MQHPLSASEHRMAIRARGFMPDDEGLALAKAASTVDESLGPFLEVGAYCGKSACYLGPVAKRKGILLFSLDHHRGSEENQAGWTWHEPDLVDDEIGVMDTLGCFRRTVFDADLEQVVVAVVGESAAVSRFWNTELGLVFIDGGHGRSVARADYESWANKTALGGLLLVHDVFDDDELGGLAPYEEIVLPALESGLFELVDRSGSLAVLRRVK